MAIRQDHSLNHGDAHEQSRRQTADEPRGGSRCDGSQPGNDRPQGKRRALSSKGAPVAATGRLEDGRDTRLDSISAASR